MICLVVSEKNKGVKEFQDLATWTAHLVNIICKSWLDDGMSEVERKKGK